MIAFPRVRLPLAIAGVAAAAAPIIIHLFNKSRFREIDWGAMDFLLEAAKRSRSLLRFRDLWLLVLRTAAVVLFGLAVARPFLRLGAGATAGRGPIHAILVVDNSMSMGRERLGGRTLLDDAKDRAKDAFAKLPAGSRATVIPLCGPAGSYSLDPLRTQEDAVEAIDAIRVIDRRHRRAGGRSRHAGRGKGGRSRRQADRVSRRPADRRLARRSEVAPRDHRRPGRQAAARHAGGGRRGARARQHVGRVVRRRRWRGRRRTARHAHGRGPPRGPRAAAARAGIARDRRAPRWPPNRSISSRGSHAR